MSIKLFDLAGANPALRFSPFCWRTRMSLVHKGLQFETVPWRFMDRSAIAQTQQARVPVILDNGRWVNDSWTIAEYLDETYKQRPLFTDLGGRATARFIASWCDTTLLPVLRNVAVRWVFNAIAEGDKPYFRESREKAFGMKMEAIGADAAAAHAALAAALKPMEPALTSFSYLGGEEAGYADYCLFGSLMWPYVVCPKPPLEPGSALTPWFERMLDLHGGHARKATTVRAADMGKK